MAVRCPYPHLGADISDSDLWSFQETKAQVDQHAYNGSYLGDYELYCPNENEVVYDSDACLFLGWLGHIRHPFVAAMGAFVPKSQENSRAESLGVTAMSRESNEQDRKYDRLDMIYDELAGSGDIVNQTIEVGEEPKRKSSAFSCRGGMVDMQTVFIALLPQN